MKIIIIVFFSVKTCTAQNFLNFGIDYQFKYNFKNHQNGLLFNLGIKKHEILLGPEYTFTPQPLPIADVIYHSGSWGGMLGYRYSFFDKWNLSIFGQFYYSIFLFKYDQYQFGPPKKQTINKIIGQNTVHIGIRYLLFNRLSLNAGFGMGSNAGFFLIMEDNFPSLNFGLGVKIK